MLELRAELLQPLVRADLVGLDDLQQLRELGACRRLVVVRHRREKRELNLAVDLSTRTVADTIVHRLGMIAHSRGDFKGGGHAQKINIFNS